MDISRVENVDYSRKTIIIVNLQKNSVITQIITLIHI